MSKITKKEINSLEANDFSKKYGNRKYLHDSQLVESFQDFLKFNCDMSLSELRSIVDMKIGDTLTFGGGAAPIVVLERIEDYTSSELLDIKMDKTVKFAEDLFWNHIARSFPEIKNGDFPITNSIEFSEHCKQVAVKWYEINKNS